MLDSLWLSQVIKNNKDERKIRSLYQAKIVVASICMVLNLSFE